MSIIGALRNLWRSLFAQTRFKGVVVGRGEVPSVFEGTVAKMGPHGTSDADFDKFNAIVDSHSDVVMVTTALYNDALSYFFAGCSKNILALVTASGNFVAHGTIVANEYMQMREGERKVVIGGARGVFRHLATGDRVRIELRGDVNRTALLEKINSP
mgnify:CR=1 FL=1